MSEIQDLEKQISDLTTRLNLLRLANRGDEVREYGFTTTTSDVRLSDLFGDHDKLLVIHNLGQGCRYCTLWADGFSGILSHLESAMSVVLVSKDSSQVQRKFANSRGWRFRMASHARGDYTASGRSCLVPTICREPSFMSGMATRSTARTHASSGRVICTAQYGSCLVWPDCPKPSGRRSTIIGRGRSSLRMAARTCWIDGLGPRNWSEPWSRAYPSSR
ncbi:MAG: peroxiredoxin [Planctomycetota bacterium]|jgi:peroxiredoxin